MIDFLFLQAVGFHIALELLGPDLHGGALLRGGVGLDQGPGLAALQYVDCLAGAGDHADVIGAALLGPGQHTDLLPLFAFDDGNRPGEDLPYGFLVHVAHLHLPEADLMVALDGAVLVGRMVEDIRRQGRIPGAFRQVFPLLDLLRFAGRQIDLLFFLREGFAGRHEQEEETEHKAQHF